MIVQLLVVMYWTRKLPYLARDPGTVAAVMCLVAGTDMGRRFAGMGLESLGSRERDEMVEGLGWRFGYGWRREEEGDGEYEEGRVRWVVDYVSDGESRTADQVIEGRGLLSRDTDFSGSLGSGIRERDGREWRDDCREY